MYNFAEAYGFECGEKKNESVNFEDLEVNGFFITPPNRVDDISLDIADSMGLTGNRILIVANHPYPQLTDDGIIGIQDLRTDFNPARLSMFVNDTSADPNPPEVRDGSQPEPYLKPRNTWLKPGMKYYWRIYWAILNEGQNYPPLSMSYYGTGFGAELTVPGIDVVIDGIEYWAVPK